MLRYLGSGPRQFGLFPLKAIARFNWEFFAVVRGRCAPVLPGAGPGERVGATLWVFPPGSSHTWAGDGTRRAYVAVFHFGTVPLLLETLVRERGHLAVRLNAAEVRRVHALARELRPDFEHPTRLSNLVFQRALLELALLALQRSSPGRHPLPGGNVERVVEGATAWFAEHARDNPSIEEVARQVHVSASTLRRFFRQTLRERPARVFRRLQIEKGMRLMTETKLKLDGIAEECGFTSASDFCRAFKAHVKVSPNTWRRTLLAPPRAAVAGGPH